MSKGESRGIGVSAQVEVGYLHKNLWINLVVVLAESWPSWSFVLDSLGCSNVITYSEHQSEIVKAEFESTHLGDTLRNNLDEMLQLCLTSGFPIVCIQGSAEFCSRMEDFTDSFSFLSRVIVTSMSSVEEDVFAASGNGGLISHWDVGGLTDGSWTYSCNQPLVLEPSSLRRNLSLVLNPINGGMLEEEFLLRCRGNELVLSGQDVLPVGVMSKMFVRSSCVFTGDNLVVRPLSSIEYMDCYDIDVIVKDKLVNFWKEHNIKPSLDFISQAPGKVLITLGRALMKNVLSSSKIATARNEDHLLKRERDLISSCNQEELGSGEGATLLGPTQAAFTDIEVEDVTAAKHDDAKVDVSQWDIWSVNNFCSNVSYSSTRSVSDTTVLLRPLVCTKDTYCPDKHGRLFNALRSLLHRKYRLLVTRSLLRYLGDTHRSTLPSISGGMDARSKEEVVVGGIKRGFTSPSWIRRLQSRKRKSCGDDGISELRKDVFVGRDAIVRASSSSWWLWEGGSTIFYWRWPAVYRKSARDGTPLFIDHGRLPRYTEGQRDCKEENIQSKVRNKVNGLRSKGYISPGLVKSITLFFHVLKGKDDIRMVFDATKCELNAALWCPKFFLPTIDSILRNASDDTWFGDLDLGEMFLNFWLDEQLRPYAGVDVKSLGERGVDEDGNDIFILSPLGKTLWERWNRTLMGLKPSPYICTQSFGWCEDFIRGNRLDPQNPLRWDRVIMNLPGQEGYDPTRPWVYRWCDRMCDLAAFFGTYVDDIRTGAGSEGACRLTSRRVASRINYLGLQDAARKRRAPSKSPGAWAGAICRSITSRGLFVSCSLEKWQKGKAIIERLVDLIVVKEQIKVSFTDLEKDVGFLVHLSRTFPAIFPYLRGLYNTMNGWREGRDDDGWKMTNKEWKLFLSMDEDFGVEPAAKEGGNKRKRGSDKKHFCRDNIPMFVTPVPRAKADLEALGRLFESESPPNRLVRGREINVVRYGFGDAAKSGFGASWIGKEGLKYRLGIWSKDDSDGSSNYRELKNLVETLMELSNDGDLDGVEIFLFTDNSVSEAAFFNGSSKSRKLFELILELRVVEMKAGARFHFIHCSGKRMIAQGSDGLSRGQLSEGVMRGLVMSSFIPLHQSAIERSDKLKAWVESWAGVDVEWLEPTDWFLRGHDILEDVHRLNCDGMEVPTYKKGTYIWTPAPAAAEMAFEELRKARHKRTDSTHLIIIPRLMEPYWRKHAWKVADLIVRLPAGHSVWPTDMYEPLTLAFVFPLLKHRPWQLKRSPAIVEMGKRLSKMWEEDESSEGFILQQFWEQARSLDCLSKDMVFRLLRSKGGFDLSGSVARK